MSTAHERQIASLVAENNALHQQLVAAADAHDQHARKTALVIRRLESELCDVRFLNAQHLLRIQLEQRRVEDERRRADDLMKKWHVWTGKSRVAEPPAAAAAQRLELPNGPLAPMVFSAAAGNGPGGARPPSPTLFVADMVKLAEARSRDEQQRANDLEAVVADMDAQLADAKAQLGTREAEIQRLTLLLQSGRGAGGGGSNGNGGDYPRPEHLERQLDLVQSTLEDVKTAAEKKEASLQARLRDATAANDRLQAELVSLKQQVTALQQASDQSVLVDLTDEVEALRGLLQTAHREYEALSRELSTATAPPPQSGPPPATTCANCAQRSSTAAASVSAAAVQADLATATNSQPMQDLQAQLEHERHLRSALVSELRALNDAVASLAGQCEQLVREREQQSQQQQQQQQQQPQKQQRSSSIADSPTPCQSCVALRASCLSLDAENRRLLSQVAALQSTHRELETQLVDHSECAPRLDSAQVEIRRLTFERGDLCRTAEEQKTTLQSLRQELAEASARAEIARQSATKLTTLNMELAELRAIKSTLDAQLRQTTATSNQHLAQIGYLHQRAQELELEKRNLSTEINNVAADLTSLIKENRLLATQVQESHLAQREMNQHLKRFRQEVLTHQEALRRSELAREQVLQAYQHSSAAADANQHQLQTLTQTVQQLQLELAKAQHRIVELRSGTAGGAIPARAAVSQPPPPPVSPNSAGITRDFESMQGLVANDPSLMRRKALLEAAQ